jgi:HlyD family secretion protein
MRKLLALLLLLAALSCRRQTEDATYIGVLEGTVVHVPALTGGRIVRLPVEEGQQVEPGDTVAVVDTTELVLQGQLLTAGLDELAAQEEVALTQLRRAAADLEYVRQKHQRLDALYRDQATPRQSLDDLGNVLQQSRSAHDAARQQARALEAKRRQLEVQLALVRKRMADAVALAPAAGLVTTRYYEPGEAVPPLQPVVELVEVQQLEVKVYVPEEKLPAVSPGQPVSVRVDGLDREQPGRVSWVSPKAEFTPKSVLTPQTRAALVYAVKIAVPNPERILKHGMPVEVRL